MAGIGDAVEGDGRYCGAAGCLGVANSSRLPSSSSGTSSRGACNVDCKLEIVPNDEIRTNSYSLKVTSRDMNLLGSWVPESVDSIADISEKATFDGSRCEFVSGCDNFGWNAMKGDASELT